MPQRSPLLSLLFLSSLSDPLEFFPLGTVVTLFLILALSVVVFRIALSRVILLIFVSTTGLFFPTSVFFFLISNFHSYFCCPHFLSLSNLPPYLFLSPFFLYSSIHASSLLASIVIELSSTTSYFQVSLKGRGAHSELGTLTLDLSGASELCNILC